MSQLLGKTAPGFAITDEDGTVHELSQIEEDYVLLYFYPKDSTPGCTIEANEFNKALSKFAKAGTAVIGISGGTEKSKEKFCEKNSLSLTLLSDPDFAVSDKYGVYGEKKMAGRKYLGIKRTTFIIGPQRKVIKVFDSVKPEGHAKEVLDFLQTL